MKYKLLLAALCWLTVISLAHVQLNVGWKRLASLVSGRQELLVGYLPVT